LRPEADSLLPADPHLPSSRQCALPRIHLNPPRLSSSFLQECYHCSITHPGFVKTTDLKTYTVTGKKGIIEHYVKAKPEALLPGADPEKVRSRRRVLSLASLRRRRLGPRLRICLEEPSH